MVGTSRAVTNDSIDGESKDVYRHEEAQRGASFYIHVSKRYFKKICPFLNYDENIALEYFS